MTLLRTKLTKRGNDRLILRCDICQIEFEKCNSLVLRKNSNHYHNLVCYRLAQKKGGLAHQKFVETCLENFGVENPNKDKTVRSKIVATNRERRECDTPFESDDFKKKSKLTNLRKRGVEFCTQSPDVISKIESTNILNYGVRWPAQAESVREKYRETCVERFGVDNPSKLPEIIEKGRITCIERYGVPNFSQTNEFMSREFGNNIYKHGHISTRHGLFYYRSSYEESFLQLCDQLRNVVYVKPNVRVAYVDNFDVERYYFVDFLILLGSTQILVEVKPACFVNNSHVKLKASFAQTYACQNSMHYMFVTQNDLKSLRSLTDAFNAITI